MARTFPAKRRSDLPRYTVVAKLGDHTFVEYVAANSLSGVPYFAMKAVQAHEGAIRGDKAEFEIVAVFKGWHDELMSEAFAKAGHGGPGAAQAFADSLPEHWHRPHRAKRSS